MLDAAAAAARAPTHLGPSVNLESAKAPKESSGVSISTSRSFMNLKAVV